jgi:transposase-like protein
VIPGDRVECQYRRALCVVTSWSDAPVPWPRVRGLESRGGSGLLVNEELARAIKTESAAALAYWFGVSANVAWKWRQAFGVSGTATTPGSAKAHREVCKAAAEVNKTRERTDEELDALAEAARRRNQARYFRLRWRPANGGWTKKELALLGTDDNEAVAKKLGRTLTVVGCRMAGAYSGEE